MAERSQHSNILLAFISLTAVIVIVSLIGFFTLGKGPEIIQGQAEADEYRVSSWFSPSPSPQRGEGTGPVAVWPLRSRSRIAARSALSGLPLPLL
jgi:hypothetical protein